MHGRWGVAPLLQKSNFCEPKRDNFRNLTPFVLLWADKISVIIIDVMLIGRQTMINCFVFERWRHAALCYTMLCYIYPNFKHRPCSHNYASKTLALRPFWQTYKQLCDNNLVSIPYNLYSFHSFLWFVSFSNADVIPYIFLLEAMLGNTPQMSSHELAYTTKVDTSRFL